MKHTNDLQKFTETETVINDILQKNKIEKNDIEHLTNEERDYFGSITAKKLSELKGNERDKFIKKIESIIVESTKNDLWEYNHTAIIRAISVLIQKYGRMPTKTEIATETELSKQTVHIHLKDFGTNEFYLEHLEQFKIMMPKVLAKVFTYAVNGDIAAAKLYFNIIGYSVEPNNVLTQNNYIQINNTVLSQKDIAKLTPEKLEILEQVLNSTTEEQPLFEDLNELGITKF